MKCKFCEGELKYLGKLVNGDKLYSCIACKRYQSYPVEEEE